MSEEDGTKEEEKKERSLQWSQLLASPRRFPFSPSSQSGGLFGRAVQLLENEVEKKPDYATYLQALKAIRLPKELLTLQELILAHAAEIHLYAQLPTASCSAVLQRARQSCIRMRNKARKKSAYIAREQAAVQQAHRLEVYALETLQQVTLDQKLWLAHIVEASQDANLDKQVHVPGTPSSSTPSPSSLRQTMRQQLARRSQRVQITRQLASTLESWATAASKVDPSLSGSLRNCRKHNVDTLVIQGENARKTMADTDDALWKQYQDAQQAQAKAEQRLQQSSEHSIKAKEQLSQHNGDDVDDGEDAVSKSLANVFAMLPNRGELANKLLTNKTRASVARISAAEADQRELKGRALWDAAVTNTHKAKEAYTSNAQIMSQDFAEEERKAWDDVRKVIHLVSGILSKRQNDQRETIKQAGGLDTTAIVNHVLETGQSLQRKLQQAERDLKDPQTEANCYHLQEFTSESIAVNNSFDDSLDGSTEFNFDADNTEEDRDDVNEDESSDMINLKETPKWSESFRNTLNTLGMQQRKDAFGMNTKVDLETSIFLRFFWPDPVDIDTIPKLVTSFACSARDDSSKTPRQYGRAFLSSKRLVFVDWERKKLSYKWSDIIHIERSKKFIGGLDDSLFLTYRKEGSTEEGIVVLDGFFDAAQALEVMGQLQSASSAEEAVLQVGEVKEALSSSMQSPEKDLILEQMEVVLSRHIDGITVQRFYEVVFSEKEKKVYQPWLEKAAFDVSVGPWEQRTNNGQWCRESYDSFRKISFKVKRQTHLYIGPPIANVTQTHHCRVEKERCIVQMTISFEGIPYSDSFCVEVRWVAKQEGPNILVQVGVCVDFKKSTMFKSQIRSGTIEETTPTLVSFFETAQELCVEAGGHAVAEEEILPVSVEKIPTETSKEHLLAAGIALIAIFIYFLRRRQPVASVDQRLDALEAEIKVLQASVNEILYILKHQDA